MLKSVFLPIIFVAYVRTRKEFFIVAISIIFGMYCNYVFQIMQCWFGFKTPRMAEDVWWDATRYSGFFYDTNALGSFSLVFVLPLLLYGFKHAGKKSSRIILGCALGLSALGVFLTISRSAFLGLMIFTAMVFFKDIKKISTILIIVIVFAAIANLAGDKWTRDTITTSEKRGQRLDKSSSVRFAYWGQAVSLIFKHPVLGVGPGRAKVAAREELGSRKANETHNTVLHCLLEFGLAGFIPFCCIPIIAWRALGRLIRSKASFFAEYAAYYRPGMLAFLFCSMFFSMHIVPMCWVPFVIPVVLEKIYALEQRPV